MVARVQNAGLAWITSLLAAAARWLQWGTGSAAATTANLVTTTTTTEARASATPSQTTGTVASDTASSSPTDMVAFALAPKSSNPARPSALTNLHNAICR